MHKRKMIILLEVLSKVSANCQGAEDFIKDRLEKISSFREKITVEEVIYFFSCFILSLMKVSLFGVIVRLFACL